MSIVPTGRRKDQVRQGAYQNDSIFSADLFEKIAITGELDLGKKDPSVPDPSPDLQNIMNRGGLDRDGLAGRQDADRMPPDAALQDQQPGIAPAGGGRDLHAIPMEQQQEQPVASIRQNIAQISQYLSQRQFALQDHPKAMGNEGLYQFMIGPVQGMGMPQADLKMINEMADTIASLMGATVPDTPEAVSVADQKSGVFKIIVQMTPQVEKVTKGGI